MSYTYPSLSPLPLLTYPYTQFLASTLIPTLTISIITILLSALLVRVKVVRLVPYIITRKISIVIVAITAITTLTLLSVVVALSSLRLLLTLVCALTIV